MFPSSSYQCANYTPQAGCIPIRIKKRYVNVQTQNNEKGSSSNQVDDQTPAGKMVMIDFQIMLVTSGSGETWVFPKGSIKKNESKKEAAKRETFEEAGLKGKFIKNIEPLEVADHSKECNLTYYILYVKKKKKEWDESDKRLRNWFSLSTVLNEGLPMKPHIQQAIIGTQRAMSIYQNSVAKEPLPEENFKLKKKEIEMVFGNKKSSPKQR